MAYAVRPSVAATRRYGVQNAPVRPYYGGTSSIAGTAGAGALGGALGALGGTLGCLLCLAAIGALGLFSCVVAITAYTKQFLNRYKSFNGQNGGAEQLQIASTLLIASLFYAIVCRMQRS